MLIVTVIPHFQKMEKLYSWKPIEKLTSAKQLQSKIKKKKCSFLENNFSLCLNKTKNVHWCIILLEWLWFSHNIVQYTSLLFYHCIQTSVRIRYILIYWWSNNSKRIGLCSRSDLKVSILWVFWGIFVCLLWFRVIVEINCSRCASILGAAAINCQIESCYIYSRVSTPETQCTVSLHWVLHTQKIFSALYCYCLWWQLIN